MYFLFEDDDLFEKCNTMWDKISTDVNKESDSELVYDKEFLKAKIKSHVDKATVFYDKEIPNVHSNQTCFTIISLYSALKKDENCYPQVFLKESKYIEKNVIIHIHDNLGDFSYSSDDFDEEYIKAIKLVVLEKTNFKNIFFEGATLRMYSGCLSSQK